MNKLFYGTAAMKWEDGLPVGNGRLAGMVWGGSADRLTLNHEWLWTGRNKNRKAQQAAEGLPLVREYIRRGDDPYMATALANSLFGGKGGLSGLPGRVDDYQPAGELCLEYVGDAVLKSRELDIYGGISTVCRRVGEAEVSAEFFADCVGQCILARWTGTQPFSAALSIGREAEEGTELTITADMEGLRLDGSIQGGICFGTLVKVRTDGQVRPGERKLLIDKCTYIQCIVNIATSHDNLEQELTGNKDFRNYDRMREEHRKRFSELMGRLDFSLAGEKNLDALTTEERLRRVREGCIDTGLDQLYFDYGRYLLLSSSICGQLPANLQGKWNDSLKPAWNCDYHFDINIQMNYWMAEPAGMPECAQALIRFLRSFLVSGREVAGKLYGCKGIVLPIQGDAWGISTPESYGWAVWIGAAAWVAQHLWEHYRYSGDVKYLRTEAYEFFTAVAEFYEDYLVKDGDGVYQIIPSQSPENTIYEAGSFPVLLDQSSAMDVQLCYDALGYAIEAAEILGVDENKAAIWRNLRENLPGFSIGSDGRLMEWQKEFQEKEPGHRHLSHLYGIYPSSLFTPETRKEQYEAGIRSLEYRLSHGGGPTGWSCAWVACLLARIGEREKFYEYYTAINRNFSSDSLLDMYKPHIFQIDANLGAVAAALESVVSYYDGAAHLLRGLPAEWGDGHLNGVRLPGGHVAGIAWKNGVLDSLEVTMGFALKAEFEYNGKHFTAEGNQGQVIQFKL